MLFLFMTKCDNLLLTVSEASWQAQVDAWKARCH